MHGNTRIGTTWSGAILWKHIELITRESLLLHKTIADFILSWKFFNIWIRNQGRRLIKAYNWWKISRIICRIAFDLIWTLPEKTKWKIHDGFLVWCCTNVTWLFMYCSLWNIIWLKFTGWNAFELVHQKCYWTLYFDEYSCASWYCNL